MAYSTLVHFDSIILIESLPTGDMKTGRDLFEQTLLPAHKTTPSLLAEIYEPATAKEFHDTLTTIELNARRHAMSPIVHIEAHGGKDGLQLASGDLVPWDAVAPALTVLNQTSRMNTLIVAAMCHGWYMSDILRPTVRAPAFGVIGTNEALGAYDLLQRMKAFYGSLLSTFDLREALQAANPGRRYEDWGLRLQSAEILLCKAFAHYVLELNTGESQADRVSRLVGDVARARSLDVTQTMQLREAMTRDLDDHGRWFEYYRNRFLMLDLFPENSPRFPLRFADCSGSAV